MALNPCDVYLNYQQLQALPQRLFDDDMCATLHRLYLNNNLLQSLPPEIKMFQHLRELHLRNNSLKVLPTEVCELVNLQVLVASNNNLTSLPQSIGRLRNIRRLQCSENHLKQLPSEIGQLELLQSLEVSNNELKWLPSQLSCCSSLRQLSVDRNLLVTLPRQLCRLRQLTEISASNNRLLSLPQDLGAMPELQAVYVDNNPFLKAIPASTLHMTIGFCRSGESDLPEHLQDTQQNIVLDNRQETEEIIPLPPEIRYVQHISSDCVPSLTEKSLQKLFKQVQSSESSCLEEEIPAQLLSLLQCPTAHCQHCNTELFVSAFPMVFHAQVQARCLLLLGLCCSVACVRQCSLIVNLPLLYPRLEDLSLALVLA